MAKTKFSIPLFLLALVIMGEIYFVIGIESDWPTWTLENLPVFLAIPLLLWLHPRLKLTNLTLAFLAFHAFVLMLGGHYTYAKVPIGFWIQEAFDFKRNHYDRFGHLMQGMIPAIALRELLLKTTVLKRGWFLSIVIVSMCLAFSAFYEMIEWWAALIMGQGADAFLGTQGDPWDTQWDMFLALVGACLGVTIVAWLQDKQLVGEKSDARVAPAK